MEKKRKTNRKKKTDSNLQVINSLWEMKKKTSVKHGGGGTMLWKCLAVKWTIALHDCIMRKEIFLFCRNTEAKNISHQA